MASQLDLDLREFIQAGLFQPIDPHTGLFAVYGQNDRVLLWLQGNEITWHGEDGDHPAAEITDETVWMISDEFQHMISRQQQTS